MKWKKEVAQPWLKFFLFVAALALVLPLPLRANLNPTEALETAAIRKAAEQGDADAQHNLGVMYVNGAGVPKDAQQAYFWWLLASAQGETNSAKNRDLIALRLTPAQRAQAHDKARDWKPKQ
jgi:TPR repeat protein